MLVAVHPAPQVFFRIVDVHDVQAPEADLALESSHGFGIGRARAQIVAGGEHVARVQADAQALRTPHLGQDGGDLLESVADRRPLAGHGLDGDARPAGRQPHVDLVDGPGHPAHPEVVALSHVSARVHHEPFHPQPPAALQLLDDRADRPRVQRVVGRAQIDQVGVVRHDRVDARPRPRRPEALHLGVSQGAGGPLIVALVEDLDGRAADGRAPLDGEIQTAGDRHVGPEGPPWNRPAHGLHGKSVCHGVA